MPKRVAIYTRVSTDTQTTENQRRELEAVAVRSGEDAGISGAKGRDKRPQFDALCKGATRREFDMVMAWSVDRLGRSLQDLVAFINELTSVGCDLYLHRQALDTSTPSGRAMFQMCGVFAEFERGTKTLGIGVSVVQRVLTRDSPSDRYNQGYCQHATDIAGGVCYTLHDRSLPRHE